MVYDVQVLFAGYSSACEEGMVANCSCTLIRGRKNIIVDTMTPWDKERIIAGLARYHLSPEDITLVVCTHGHSDHIGNNNLFLNAKHIVGYSVSYRDVYNLHPFEEGEPYIVDEDIKIVPTPGHTNADVSVLVRTMDLGIVAIVGDLFERKEDLEDPTLWRVAGGSENPKVQEKNRNKMLLLADHIVPGHGPMFAVTSSMRKEADLKLHSGSREDAPDRRAHEEREWRNRPEEIDERLNPNHGHRPSVWEGRLGPSFDYDVPRDHPGPRGDRPTPRREELDLRGLPDRDKHDREPWDDRRRLPNDHPFSPPPLLDEDTLKRLEHKRQRESADSWDGRRPRPYPEPERVWLDRCGPDDRLPPPDRSPGERRDGFWDKDADRMGYDIMMLNDRIRDDRPRFREAERLPIQEDRLRREERPRIDERPRLVRNGGRPPRDRNPPPENKPDKEEEKHRFGSGAGDGKLRVSRGTRGKGRKIKTKTVDSPNTIDGGPGPSRRDEVFRREGRDQRRPPDDRLSRMKDGRTRRETRTRDEEFHDRNIRIKHDGGGRNPLDARTMRHGFP